MRIIIVVSILLLYIQFLPASAFIQADVLAADTMAAKYRTGKIDPAIATIPYHIRTHIFIKPEEYLKELVDFFASDADNEYHIVKRIHDWIADTIAYEFRAETRIYKFLKLKRTNCMGYSSLFKKNDTIRGNSCDNCYWVFQDIPVF